MSNPTHIKRDEVAKKARAHMLATLTKEELLDAYFWADDISGMRNYEIEENLSDTIGGDWVVSEMCPFNGVFCDWGHLSGEYAEFWKAKASREGWDATSMLAVFNDGKSADVGRVTTDDLTQSTNVPGPSEPGHGK